KRSTNGDVKTSAHQPRNAGVIFATTPPPCAGGSPTTQPSDEGGGNPVGHVQDLWFKTAINPDTGRPTRVKTGLHANGQRYRDRSTDPDGRERRKSFPDRHKRQAEDFLGEIENDKRRGSYLDPIAGRILFRTYAESWLASHAIEESSRETVGIRLRKHVFPRFGQRPLASITPADIRSWDRELAHHIQQFPPIAITLPWRSRTGEPVTAKLILYTVARTVVLRPVFNRWAWKPALRKAGASAQTRVDGFHALRHFYASTLLDAGESIVALAEY